MLNEFKTFAVKGNMVDLAVGVIIGGAFGKIVSSLVSDIVMPVVGLAAGKVDFSNLFISLDGRTFETLKKAKEAGAPTLNYGIFLNTVLDFLIVSFSIFLVVRWMNGLRRQEQPALTTKKCPFCITAVPVEASRCPACTSEFPAE